MLHDFNGELQVSQANEKCDVLFAGPTTRERPCRVEEYTFHEHVLISKRNISILTNGCYLRPIVT